MPDNGSDEPVRSITRATSRRPNVSYSSPVVLHESGKRRLVLVPFFVQRSERTELAAKLVTYRKGEGGAAWVAWEEKSLSLPESASRELYRALRDHLQVAGENAAGSFLLVRVSEGTASLGEHDPAAVAGALTKVLAQPGVVEHFGAAELSDALIAAMRGAIRLREMVNAVQELRTFLAEEANDESTYQGWCNRHSWAFGSAYVMTDAVREISPGDHLDLLLPSVISGYRDIVELKRPDAAVLQYDDAHRNYYFSAAVSRAIGQCHRYLDVLHEAAAHGLRDHPEIVAYHPRAIIVIGRSTGWEQDRLRALHGLNSRLAGVTVMTYDQLVAQGERLVSLLSAQAAEEPEPDLEVLDDEPF